MPAFSDDYAAALVDGEGTITLKRKNRRLSNGEAAFDLPASVKVSNTDSRLLYPLQAKWGGSVYMPKKQKEWHKQIYVWELTAGSCIPFLRAIEGSLVTKAEQSIIVRSIAAVNTKRQYWKRKPIWKLLLESLAEGRIRELNHRSNYCHGGAKKVTHA